MAPKNPVLIRVLLLHEGPFWVAQALEADIAAQGRTQEEARLAFLRTVEAQIAADVERGRQPLSGIPQAPDWYFEAYSQAHELPEWLRSDGNMPAYIAQAVSDQHVSA